MLGRAWEVRRVLGLSMGFEEDDREVRRVLGRVWKVRKPQKFPETYETPSNPKLSCVSCVSCVSHAQFVSHSRNFMCIQLD